MSARYHVGQTLIVTNPFGRRGHQEEVVSNVGRKFFYTGDGYGKRRFWIETGDESIPGGYSGGSAYTPEEWADRALVADMRSQLKELGVEGRWPGRTAFSDATAAQLQQIIDVLRGTP